MIERMTGEALCHPTGIYLGVKYVPRQRSKQMNMIMTDSDKCHEEN